MLFSIIICTYNRVQYIYQTLKCIALNSYEYTNYEVLLIDNNSDDGTVEECNRFEKEFPRINYRYIREFRQGLSYARNRGIEEARGQILVFLDDDAFVSPDYLYNLDSHLKKNPLLKVFGGKIDPLFESGKTPDWLSPWSYSWLSAINKGSDVCLFSGKEYPIGANMGFHREVFKDCGIFNVELGRTLKNLMGGEEKDFFFRVKAEGYDIFYLPDVSVQHCIPESRLTFRYIERLGEGVGCSERLRTQSQGSFAYIKRCFMEFVKWVGTLLIWCVYIIKQQPEKGYVLLLFRKYVTKGLLSSR